MRIKLKKGKQKELISLAKNKHTWRELSNTLNINQQYLCHELNNEKILLSEESYNKLCRLANQDFDNLILERLDNNWGRSKGGRNSQGTAKNILVPSRNEELAEVIGAVLGDGNVCYYKKGKKIGVYQVKIAGDKRFDKEYHMKYLYYLFKELFGIEGKEMVSKDHNSRYIYFSSKKLVNFFVEQGHKAGDKIANQVTIPSWIKENPDFLKACLRGLIDTDGCIHRMSNQDPQLLRINFTNYNKRLLQDARESFIGLGFKPTKIILNKRFYLSRKDDITKYLKEIGFSNKKHIDRLNRLKSPIV